MMVERDPLHDWVLRLASKMREGGEGYQALKSVLRGERRPEDIGYDEDEDGDIGAAATRTASLVLIGIRDALSELPTMQDNPGMVTLRDVILAMGDLGRGLTPPLLQPAPDIPSGHNKDTHGRDVLKYLASASGHMLVAIGLTKKRATEEVAKILTDAGQKGRRSGKGEPFPAKTVAKWMDEYPGNSDSEGCEFVGLRRANWKADPAWPPTPAKAKGWIKELAHLPEMKSQI